MFSMFNIDVDNRNNVAADDNDIGVNFSFFTSEDAASIATIDNTPVEKKKKSKAKTVEVVPSIHEANAKPGVIDVDYSSTYGETTNLLRGAIIQADQMAGEIQEDLDAVRGSKTLKGKYTYITNLTSAKASILSTKIAAIREMNSSITQSHNLELNRMKALKLDQKNENDDMRIMDIYSAFVNQPVGVYTPPTANIQDLTLGVNSPNGAVAGVEMISPSQTSALTPEQNRMRMESNPNIQTVVRYDQSTGQRSFDVIDTSTGMSVPNYPRPDNFLLEDTTIDIHSGIARNRNVNSVWPLILMGSNNFVTEY